MTAPIRRLDTRLFRAPLGRPWGPGVDRLAFISVEVEDDAGSVGRGLSWTPTIGAEAVQALLDHDIRAWAIGRPADAGALWHPLWRHLHEAGGGGITTIAMAGLDLALWDLDAGRAGRPMVEHLGRAHQRVRAYGSGINRHYSFDELVAQAERWVDAGFDAVKMKVGLPELADDIRRVAAVREIIGPDRALMIDANQLWSVDDAVRAVNELAVFDLNWVEEPLRADDLAGHIRLREAIDVPIAVGENLHTRYRFGEFLDAGVADVVQPNVVRVGGITPFLQIAALADEHGATVAPHLLTELSAQLALARTADTPVEAPEGASFDELGVIDGMPPVVVEHGWARDTGQAGLGIRLVDAAAPVF
ncbi:mandelate racemase/muconate lactonizing enzyme family protein [Agromyces archimandritae]|uniref:Mandelate racemase/muconate lactonizing enzyme family protein n=1 Tax=Agromyces archimandritae TaxID=2781962 RepID=A0A975FK94_9MICO|nr:mandelate racemase/muconate lactonizing enzyme family protein [Agromyces archimandritae]QTX03524.1 mandelate racemase/muconate lactonizing enzyme family protein [Agromyces archimandritae]